MLTGVCAVSSARTKEGWLSDDACRVGISTGAGADMPLMLARLNGLEKLKAGFGRCVPPTDLSELMDGDLAAADEKNPGDIPVGEADKPLPIDGFRCSDMPGTRLAKSSSELSDIDLGLGVLCAKGDLGGANALESYPPFVRDASCSLCGAGPSLL